MGEVATVWDHLRQSDGFRRPAGTTDDQAHLMVQVMETWLIADVTAMRAVFGPRFNDRGLSALPNLEAISKERIFAALNQATRRCDLRYSKGIVSFRLLERVDPTIVRSRCRHASALLNAIASRRG